MIMMLEQKSTRKAKLLLLQLAYCTVRYNKINTEKKIMITFTCVGLLYS